ncbi:MAG: transposase [Clostridiaceae bacterium]
MAVSAENALKIFKLLGVGTFKDADGNVYSFVGGQIVRTQAGETVPVITGESAVEWLLSHADGFYYVRNGVTYTFDATLTAEEAIRIRYSLTQDTDGEWYYTHPNGSIYRLDNGDLVYDHTPATLADLTAADALITLKGMVVGYKSGDKTIYLDAGLLTNADVAAFFFTADGGYYSDEDGNRYTLEQVTSGSESYYVLNYSDTPLSLPDLDSDTDLVHVMIPGEAPNLYRDAQGHLYLMISDTQFQYINKIYWLDDTFVTGKYIISDLTAQITGTADRLYVQDGTEKTYTKAEETATDAMRLIYGVTASSPRYVNPDGYVYQLKSDGSALVYTGEREGVTPLIITGAGTKSWLLANYTGWTALGRQFAVTPILDSVSGLPTGEYDYSGTLADALRLVYEINDSDLYTDSNGNVYQITGDDLVYLGTLTNVEDLTGAEALQWLYSVVNGVYTDTDGNVFQLISGNLLYHATIANLPDITGSAFDAIYYAYKAVSNSNVAFEMTTKKQVWLERLTDVLATDVLGRYYLYSGTAWSAVGSGSISHTSEDKSRTTNLIGGDGVTIIGTVTNLVRTVRDTITHADNTTTVVERVFVWSAEKNLWLQESVMIQLPNGTKVHSDGTIEPASADALTMHIVSCNGVQYLLGLIEATLGSGVITMHDTAGSMLDGNGDALNIRAGEDIEFYLRTTGTVGSPSEMLDVSAGHKVMVLDISGDRGLISSSMYLFVPAAEGSITLEENTRIINGATYNVETENGDILGNRIEVIAGNLILDAHSNGSDPLISGAIQINTLIVHYDPAQDATLESEKVLHSTATLTAQGDIGIDALTADDGSTVDITSTSGGLTSETWNVDDSNVTATVHGTIALDDVTITNGSIVSLTSSSGGLTSESWDVDDSNVTATVHGDIALDDATLTNGSDARLTSAAGGLDSDMWTISNSEITALVYDDIALDALTLTGGSIARLTSTAGDLTSDSWKIENSDLYANIYGAIDLGTAELIGGSATLYGKTGGLTMNGLYVKDGTWNAAVYDDIKIPLVEAHNATLRLQSTDGGILLHLVQAEDSKVSLVSYKGIGLIDGASGNPLIQFAKDDTPATASLTLGAANGDIGSADCHLWIDIPAEITVRIESVKSYFINAVDLPLATYPDYAVFGGWNGSAADSVYLKGVYLRYSDEQFFQILLGANTAEELAAWVSQRAASREYLDNLDATALWSLVHSGASGSVNAAMLITLFGNTLGKSLYTAMTGTTPTIRTDGELLNAVSTALLQKQTANPTAYVIDGESAKTMLTVLLNQQLILSLGELLGTLLTSADVTTLYQCAMQASTRPADTYLDTAARAFHLNVGRSMGSAFVNNEGDITISQDTGDLTIGTICSVRGDVQLDALSGSIFGADADHLVTGWDITLNASGSVGTASLPIHINQRTNQPELLLNVDEEIYKSGLTAFGTAFGTRFDPAGAGTIVPPVIVPFGMTGLVYEFTQIPLTNADGSPKLDAQGKPVLGWALRAAVRYDWLRITNDLASTAFNASATGGGVFVEEQSGALGLGVIRANGDVSLTSPDTISDQRDGSQRTAGDNNVSASGGIRLVSTNGSIGTSKDAPLLIDAKEDVLAQSMGGVYLNSSGDLTLDLDSASGSIALTSGGAAKIVSHGGATLAGFVYAAYGVSIEANGDIGTLATPFVVDANRSGAGTLSLSGGNVYVTEPDGDVYLERLDARGNAVLKVSGGLYDANIGSALNAIIRRVTEAQRAADAAKAAFDAAQALTDALNQFILRQNAMLPGQIAARDAAETSRTSADAALTNAKDAQRDAQAAYNALLIDPTATPQAILTAKQALDDATRSEAQAQSSYDTVNTAYLLAKTTVENTQNALADAAAQITTADAAHKALIYAAAQAKLAREQALLKAQVAVNDAEEALQAAQSAYDSSRGFLRSAALDSSAALRLAQGVLNAAKDILSAQTAINGASDVLADPLASDADKLAATTVLANATLALNLATALKAIYEDENATDESLAIADAVLAAEQALLAAKAAYGLDASADNLARMQQSQKTLQAAKDAFAALTAYLTAKDVSDHATALSDAAAKAQADADAAQAVLDAYNTLVRYGATAEEKANARAVIMAAGGISRTQAQAMLNTALAARDAAQIALNALLSQNGFTTLSEAVNATLTARATLDGKLTNKAAHDAVNDAQAELDRANEALLAANLALAAAKSLTDAITAATSESEDAETALQLAYQAWIDARLAGSDEDKPVADALAAYLAAQSVRDEKHAALNVLLAEQTALSTLDELRAAVLAAEDAQSQAQSKLSNLLAVQPGVTLDSFGADYAADGTIGEQRATIHTGGTLTLITGTDAGTPSSPLSVDAGGIVTVQAGLGGIVAIQSPHTLHLGGISGGDVQLTANGNICDESPVGGAMITANSAMLAAILGSIGTQGNPVWLIVTRLGASANDIFVSNSGNLALDVIAAQNSATIRTTGSIFQMPAGFVQAGTVTLLAGGDIGSASAPIVVNAGALTARGGTIQITSLGNLGSVTIAGNTVILFVGGTLSSGFIQARNLQLTANGDIGALGRAVLVQVSGKCVIVSLYGLVFIRNIYRVAFNPVSTVLAISLGGRMVYLLLGVNQRGETVLLGILKTELNTTSSLDTLVAALKQLNALAVPQVLLDGLGSMQDAFTKAFGTLLPQTKLVLSSVFWFAELRKQVDPADWDAMLADYVAIYSSSTVQEVNEAIQRFGEHWGEKYTAIVSGLTSQSATPEQIVAVCDAFRAQKISLAQVIGWLSDDLESMTGGA